MNADTPFDWGEHEVPHGDELSLALGPLVLRLANRSEEFRLAYTREGEPPSSEVRTRWAPGSWSGRVRLTPALPDRLVVVKPDDEFWLLREAKARIYVRVPLQVHVEAVGASTHSLLQIPTHVLSDTWWGTPEEGELGYWLDTRARREMRPDEFLEHLCVCPLQLENTSRDDLKVDRIALRVAYLSVFRKDDQLWADETRVRYLGEEAGSRLEMAGAPPREVADAQRLTPPAERMGRGFTARTFARLRSSIGGWL